MKIRPESNTLYTMMPSAIPVIDLFAGPGGLGEGFSSFQTEDGQRPFGVALSIEKEPYAHQTLTLRAFHRQFSPEAVPGEYYDYLREADEPEPSRRRRLFNTYPREAIRATDAAWLAELGVCSLATVRDRIRNALEGHADFVLLGGPPCQAYSTIGRSRNRNNRNYIAAEDKRQRLYVEYLQVLADFSPAVFVMENVKGLLSATLNDQRIFERIFEDLNSPCEAIAREGRSLADGRRRTRYRLLSAVQTEVGHGEDLRRFTVRMERYGVPQARHRLFIIGIRTDLDARGFPPLQEQEPISIQKVISDLPELRSGLSRENDSRDHWQKRIEEIRQCSFMKTEKKAYGEVIGAIEDALESLPEKQLHRGSEYMDGGSIPQYRPDWYVDSRLSGVCHHVSRIHIPPDLHRYLFAACYGQVKGLSPDLRDFPAELIPNHKNAQKSAEDGTFDDRFHVQLMSRPSTTVTSHLAKDGHYFIHPDPCQCRSMTVREVARLQTFPDNYYFCGPRTSQYIQVGNAVPPLLASQIAASVFRRLSECGLEP